MHYAFHPFAKEASAGVRQACKNGRMNKMARV